MKQQVYPNPIIAVQQLSLFYEDGVESPTLSQLNFHLNHNENLLLLGPSGSGKSTLTYCLNGIFPNELDGKIEGEILVDDKKTTEYAPGELSQKVGVVFQDPESQFCMITVEDEVAFGLENKGIAAGEMEAKVDEVLDLVHLHPYKQHTIHSLSGGMKQKLALACVLALEPQVLILDEPTANLDPKAKKDFIHTIQSLQQEQSFSIIVIEHQLEDWIPLIDRCIMLNLNGEIFYNGSLRQGISDHYQDLKEQGIWIPKITELAIQWSNTDQNVLASYPLNVEEFSEQLQRRDNSDQIFANTNRDSMKAQTTILQAENIQWKKGSQLIISGIDFHLQQGEFVAIVGANGSGKTSFSKILARLQMPSAGRVQLFNRPLKSWQEDELRERIGYVFQNPEHQFITDNVFDEVAFSLRLQNYSVSEIHQKVSHTLLQCQLTGLEGRHPFTLSQGQKRRLSVAIMTINDLSILILDEPTFGQDGRSNKELMRLLSGRNKEGTAIVMITHDMNLVHEYADRVVVFEDGTSVFNGKPNELWRQPSEYIQQWQLELPVYVELQNSLLKGGKNYVSSTTKPKH